MRKRKFELKRTAAAFLAVVTMALTATTVPSAAADAKGVELYVSPSGDDSAEGTVSAPLRTLEGAAQTSEIGTTGDRRYVAAQSGLMPTIRTSRLRQL